MATNITEADMHTLKKKISDFYHYSQSGADFTHDMHEKANSIKPVALGPLKAEFSATKNLNTSPGRSSFKSMRSMVTKENLQDPTGDDEDHPGVRTIKMLKTKSSTVNKELKNPREFEAFVDNITDRYIPAILIAPTTPCAKLVIFYHANAEDIGQSQSFCKDINDKLEVKFSQLVLLFDSRISRLFDIPWRSLRKIDHRRYRACLELCY